VTAFGVRAQRVGHYTAKVRVPAGGIAGIRIGIQDGRETIVPLSNDPFVSESGVRCDVVALRQVLTAFVEAYNRGDPARIDTRFSRKRFFWYASSEPGARSLPEARRRDTLLAYFRGRHRQRDHLLLRSYRFNGFEEARQLAHFQLEGERRADDFRSGRRFSFSGKGALDCLQPQTPIAVLFIGGPKE